MNRIRLFAILWAAAVLGSASLAAEFRAGAARCDITPETPIRLSGYAARTSEAAAVRAPLGAAALALDDGTGGRLVVLTADLILVPRDMCDRIAAAAAAAHGLGRDQILVNASHTHYGPIVGGRLSSMHDVRPEERERLERWARTAESNLVALVDAAIGVMRPARLTLAWSRVEFPMNRREPTPNGVRLGVNRDGPTDRAVPVLQVRDPEGGLRAVLFGCACHPTTMASTFNEVDPDFPGHARREVEARHPGAVALYVSLCAGDQNPYPRGEYEMALRYGRELAEAVCAALTNAAVEIRPPIRTAWRTAGLELASWSPEELARDLALTNSDALSRARRRRAERVLDAVRRGEPPRAVEMPVRVIRLGDEVAWVALGGEVVVDYALRLRREIALPHVIVAGYCNDVPAYIPSRRVLEEGGYEPVDSMVYYGHPATFATNIETIVIGAVREAAASIGIPWRD